MAHSDAKKGGTKGPVDTGGKSVMSTETVKNVTTPVGFGGKDKGRYSK